MCEKSFKYHLCCIFLLFKVLTVFFTASAVTLICSWLIIASNKLYRIFQALLARAFSQWVFIFVFSRLYKHQTFNTRLCSEEFEIPRFTEVWAPSTTSLVIRRAVKMVGKRRAPPSGQRSWPWTLTLETGGNRPTSLPVLLLSSSYIYMCIYIYTYIYILFTVNSLQIFFSFIASSTNNQANAGEGH